jgi:hypothetical protein
LLKPTSSPSIAVAQEASVDSFTTDMDSKVMEESTSTTQIEELSPAIRSMATSRSVILFENDGLMMVEK